MISSILRISFLVAFSISALGCAGFGKKMKAFLAGESAESEPVRKVASGSGPTRYSETPNLLYDTKDRKYERMTKNRLEDESRLEEERGSLWRMEGQGSYLFSENNVRLEGDIINVKIDGNPRKQLTTKTEVINKLLQKLKRANQPRRGVAAADAPPAEGAAAPAEGAAAGTPGAPAAPAAAAAEEKEEKADPNLFDVDLVPVRIVERLNNGNFRVRGAQNFMIDKREYKVIVTGEVRPNDVNDGVVSAPLLLDSNFDIVSPRREVQL
jgi:flagellar L-ring protein precursor FlgH